jgi:hypothetical protein
MPTASKCIKRDIAKSSIIIFAADSFEALENG